MIAGYEKELGCRIKAARLRRKLSQQVLARHVRISQSRMYEFEAGARGMTVRMLLRLTAALQVTAQDLLGGLDATTTRP